MPQFKVHLLQHEWVTTEVFEGSDTVVFPTEPTTKEEALAMAQEFVDKEKDLGDREHRLEVEEIADPEPEVETPAEEESDTIET